MYIFDIGYFVRIPLAFLVFAQSNEVAVGKIELPSLLNANMHCFLFENVFTAIRFAILHNISNFNLLTFLKGFEYSCLLLILSPNSP